MNRLALFFSLFSIISLNSLEFSQFNIGYTLDKNPIELYQFGKGKDVIFLIAGIHGNEKNTVITAEEIISQFKKTNNSLPANKSIWIIPNLNPDGYNRGRRLNNNSVDLNRNFPTRDWKTEFYLYSNRISAGKKPLSEPETASLNLFFESINPDLTVAVLSLHSRGNAVIPGTQDYYNKNLAYLLMDYTGYFFNSIGYETHGDLTRYLAEKFKIASVTIELKTKELPETDIIYKAIQSLLITDFKTKIYDHNFKLENIFKNKHSDKLDKLIEDLPSSIRKTIQKEHSSKINFIDSWEKLSANEELLLLVNKKTALDSKYIPDDLVDVTSFIPTDKKNIKLRNILIDDLKKMIEDAKNDGIRLWVVSAFRSFETQKSVYQHWVNQYGEQEASRTSAKPGTSQHQLGTAIDFNDLSESFALTKPAIWLKKNAWKYGFVLSYPDKMEDITGYKFEPWHYRYIGKDGAFLVYHYFEDNLELFLNWYWNSVIEK